MQCCGRPLCRRALDRCHGLPQLQSFHSKGILQEGLQVRSVCVVGAFLHMALVWDTLHACYLPDNVNSIFIHTHQGSHSFRLYPLASLTYKSDCCPFYHGLFDVLFSTMISGPLTIPEYSGISTTSQRGVPPENHCTGIDGDCARL